MKTGDDGFHRGAARSSAAAPNFKPPTPVQKPAVAAMAATPAPMTAPRRLFMIEVFDQNSQTGNVESAVIERGLRLGLQSFRSMCGTVREGKIIDDGGVIVGCWHYYPSAVAA